MCDILQRCLCVKAGRYKWFLMLMALYTFGLRSFIHAFCCPLHVLPCRTFPVRSPLLFLPLFHHSYFLSSSFLSLFALSSHTQLLIFVSSSLLSSSFLSSLLLSNQVRNREEEVLSSRLSPLRSDSSTLCDRGRLGCPKHYLNAHTASDTQTCTHVHTRTHKTQSLPVLELACQLKPS